MLNLLSSTYAIKMRNIVFLLLICISSTLWAQEPDKYFYDKISFAKASKVQKLNTVKEKQSYSDFDLTYQRMEWNIDPAVKYISGSVTSYFSSVKGVISKIEFDLYNGLSVDSVKKGDGKLSYSHTENILTISLEDYLLRGETDSLTVYYRGTPPDPDPEKGFGAFIQDFHNQTPIIWTLSEPYGALEWWPCKQSLMDKIDSIDIIVTSPEAYRTASIGVLVSEEVRDGDRTMHWKSRFPIATYLVAIAVTNYMDYSHYVKLNEHDSIEILNYVYPETFEDAQRWTPRTIEIMELYNDLFGVYPFASEKYGHAQFGWGGGMEHQTMSFMHSFGFDLISHELAHQWFGDYVTLSSWHDIWLNEGFATFLTGLCYQNLSNGKHWVPWKSQLIESIVSEPGGSVYVQDTTSVPRIFSGRLSYRKGAFLLHMLRWTLGDAVFFNAIRNYLNDPEIGNSFASQSELVGHLESEADTSLAEYFNDWYYGEGFPIYTINYRQNENKELEIVIYQESSHSSVGFFEMPVPIRVWNPEHSRSVDYRFQHDYSGQIFKVNPGFQISKLEFDPDLWLISGKNIVSASPLLESKNSILIYPNPSDGKFVIDLKNKNLVKKLVVYSLDGRLVYQCSDIQNSVQLDLSNLDKGNYLLHIVSESEDYSQKITIQ